MKWLLLGAALVVLIWLVYKAAIKLKDKREASKVIQLSLHRKNAQRSKSKRSSMQTCSFCRKKARRLYFYAGENGKVLGLCDVCRPQAERRALPRL